MTTIITGMRNFIEKHIGGTLLSCRLDCAIKMELRVVAIKVSQGFFLPCHSRRKLV